jgi:hypothetical protein
MNGDALPKRSGPRPRTTPTNPHTQLEQNPERELVEELARRVFTLPGVEERPSAVSVPGARALWLREDVPAGPPEAFMVGREFAHIHPMPEGSLHAALPPEVAREAIRKDWAEQHPVARTGRHTAQRGDDLRAKGRGGGRGRRRARGGGLPLRRRRGRIRLGRPRTRSSSRRRIPRSGSGESSLRASSPILSRPRRSHAGSVSIE